MILAGRSNTPTRGRILTLVLGCWGWLGHASGQQRLEHWQVSLDGGQSYQECRVPGAIEDQLDPDFDGQSIYQTSILPVPLEPSQRAILKFAAVATHAKVFVNKELVGEHLGGWTPVQIDLSSFMRGINPQPLKIRVEVDEKVGHNTQGFLPIITNHFGGIWQVVSWNIVDGPWIVHDAVGVFPNLDQQALELRIPVEHFVNQQPKLKIEIAELTTDPEIAKWQSLPVSLSATSVEQFLLNSGDGIEATEFAGRARLPFSWKPWSPNSPDRYQLRISASNPVTGKTSIDTIVFGARKFEAVESQFQLNGQPCNLRGVLNWGYAPPRFAPSLDEAWMRAEIEFAKSRGFNLMKFCLWIPPKPYLALCDELGMMAWVEYPTWHPQLDQAHATELLSEYREFYQYDRNHPSVVLRSLTCETGPGADLNVIRQLYDLCKTMIPDAVVEDDSSWIAWNRIHDFYDDHPYGNNHTWVEELGKLNDYIAQRTIQPLALGEAIAADSWTEVTPSILQLAEKHPGHAPWFTQSNPQWIEQISKLAQQRGRNFEAQSLTPQSLHYGLLMRKFQIETYQREVPFGAYVVSVIRDFPKAAMGLIDFENQPKHPQEAWSFHGDRMLILRTEQDRRSFTGGEKIKIQVYPKDLSTTGQAKISVAMVDNFGKVLVSEEGVASAPKGQAPVDFELSLPELLEPTRFELKANWGPDGAVARNRWPIWLFPPVSSPVPVVVDQSLEAWATAHLAELQLESQDSAPVRLTRRLTPELIEALEQGAKIVLIPDGTPGSFPVQDHWFLRGAPVALPSPDSSWHLPFELQEDKSTSKQDMLIELQHFDLAGPVVPNLGHYLDLVDPILLLWDNHDLRETRTHGLAFRLEFGSDAQRPGVLLVSPLNFTGRTNAAGRWLLHQWLAELELNQQARIPMEVRMETARRLRQEFARRSIELHRETWKFKPDPEDLGQEAGWASLDFDDSQWAEIRIDQHWEGQGYAALDQWAWYRKQVLIPTDWDSPKTYLNFTGVDDYAEVYVNGVKLSCIGDLENKQTAFETRTSVDISAAVQPNAKITIAVAVYDWYGAGGIFRPVTLSAQPLSDEVPILK